MQTMRTTRTMRTMHARRWMALVAVSLFVPLVACTASTYTMNAGAFVGSPAPAFSAKDDHGTTRSLADFKGKFIVLEWHNNGCPYVGKHYGSGNMQQLQKWWTGKGVIWLTVESSAPGQQGYVTAQESQAYMQSKNAAPTAVLLDPQGTVGRAYGAKVSPHMFIIDPKGVVIYNVAIDNMPTTEITDVAKAKNYVSQALNQAMAGQQVKEQTSTPYGCSVKYAGGTSN